MHARRHLILATTSALAGFTGCLATQASDRVLPLTTSARRTDRTRRSTPDTPPTVHEPRLTWDDISGLSTLVDSNASRPFRQFEVGTGGYFDAVRIWNDADAREGHVVVTAGESEILNLTDEFPADGYLDIVFQQRADYHVAIELGGVEHAVDLPAERFDCNDSGTDVAVHDTDVESQTVMTALACDE